MQIQVFERFQKIGTTLTAIMHKENHYINKEGCMVIINYDSMVMYT